MPLNKKGKEIMKSMKDEYGKKKGEKVFYASKNKGTIKNVEKARFGKLLKNFINSSSGKKIFSKKEMGATSQVGNKRSNLITDLYQNQKKTGVVQAATGKMMKVKKVKGALEKASKLHAAQAKTLGNVLKAAGGGLKEATKRLKAQGYKGGNMALKNPKKADLDKDGKLSSYERKRGKAIEDNMMKASVGMEAKSTKGYGAARTSGMGLEDQELPPGKSLDYYKDIM
jgi:DNA-binding transcriptional regulator YhcF (GntR family)